MKREIIVTGDNSKSLLIPELNETYHSVHGAAVESNHVFIVNGLAQAGKESVRIFEMGFGTGLNALLSLNHAKNTPIYIVYHTVEKYPLGYELVKLLNHPGQTGLDHLAADFEKMHTCPWGVPAELSGSFTFQKTEGDLLDLDPLKAYYDLIYFDAFGPKVQPALWSADLLRKMYDALVPGGRLVTYCAQGQFRRNLREAGFRTERRPGPPGKREMTVAHK
jgi:tRNA U34 5-methylaminomethyl-2-thiouridine-forming methyltransferase MnmC